MRPPLLAVLLAVFALSSSATAQTDDDYPSDPDRWVRMDGAPTYVDLRALVRDGDHVTLWMWRVAKEGDETDDGKAVGHSLFRIDFECHRREMTVLEVVKYAGTTLLSTTRFGRPDQEAVSWVPGSIGETIGEYVCG